MENSTRSGGRFLELLKIKGAQSAASLAAELGISVEGARLQLARLATEGFVEPIKLAGGVGRPSIQYRLTEKGNKKFPDSHQELTVQILTTVKNLLGENALNAVINARAMASDSNYAAELTGLDSLEKKLDRLVTVRSGEGYMAEYQKDDEGYIFIENHCPINSAAKYCSGFCQTELHSFENLLGPGVNVERVEHMLENGRRCAYRIKSAS